MAAQPIPQTVPPIVVTAEPQVFRNRIIAARVYAVANGLNRLTVNPAEARIGIVAAGKTYYETRQALADFGLSDADLEQRGVRILKLGMISPLDPAQIREFAAGLEEILVVEEKRSFIERQIRDILYNLPARPMVFGKEDETGLPARPDRWRTDAGPDRAGPGRPAEPLSRRRPVRGTLAGDQARQWAGDPDLGTTRAPFFCSGCPHNRSTVVPDGSLVGGGHRLPHAGSAHATTAPHRRGSDADGRRRRSVDRPGSVLRGRPPVPEPR